MRPTPKKPASTPKPRTPDPDAGDRLPRATAVVADTDQDENPAEFAELGASELADERFAVTREIARGGMGRVLAAHDLRLDRTVALKEALGESADDLSRFAREVQITAKLQHPGILPLYDARAWSSGAPYYVMRLVSGKPLAEKILEAGSLDERLTLVPAMLAAADALAFAHEKKIIHRDVKPSNILIGDHGETVVIDWGIAKLIEPGTAAESIGDNGDGPLADEATDKTRPGAILGTPGYMSPEQAAGDPADKRSDVYALGATLYHLLAGERPFEGKSSRLIMARQLAGPPEPLSRHVKGVPSELLAVVDRALARDPGDRYPDAAAFAEDLRRFQTGRLVAAHDYSIGERLVRFVRRHRAAVLVAAIAVALLTTVIVSAVIRVRGERDLAVAASARESDRADELLIAQSNRLLEAGDPTAAAALLKRLPLTSKMTERAWAVFREARRRGIRQQVRGPVGPLAAMLWHPQKNVLFVAGGTSVLAFDFDQIAPRTSLLREVERGVRDVALIADGSAIAIASRDADIAVISLSGQAMAPIATGEPVTAIAAPDRGDFIIWKGESGRLNKQAVAGGPPLVLLEEAAASVATVGGDGRWILIRDEQQHVCTLWRDGTPSELSQPCFQARFDRQGAALLLVSADVVIEFLLGGKEPLESQRWELKDVQDATFDGRDRRYAASKHQVLFLREGRATLVEASEASLLMRSTADGLAIFGNDVLTLFEPSRREIAVPRELMFGFLASSTSRRLAIGTGRGPIGAWSLDPPDREQLHVLGGQTIRFRDEQTLIVRGVDGVSTLDRRSGKKQLIAKLGQDLSFRVVEKKMAIAQSIAQTFFINLESGVVDEIPSDLPAWPTGASEGMFYRSGKLWRFEPGSEAAPTVVSALDPIAELAVHGEFIAAITENGELIGDLGRPSEARAQLELERVKGLAIDERGTAYLALDNELHRFADGVLTRVATLEEPIRAMLAGPEGIIALTATQTVRWSKDAGLIAVRTGPIRYFDLLSGGRGLIALGEDDRLVHVDFEARSSQRFGDPKKRAIALTSFADDFAVLYLDGDIEIENLGRRSAPARLRAELEEATSAAIESGTEEMVWP